jgi:hypothetical protein
VPLLDWPSGRDRFAIDILGRELAVPERIALDTTLFACLAGGATVSLTWNVMKLISPE